MNEYDIIVKNSYILNKYYFGDDAMKKTNTDVLYLIYLYQNLYVDIDTLIDSEIMSKEEFLKCINDVDWNLYYLEEKNG